MSHACNTSFARFMYESLSIVVTIFLLLLYYFFITLFEWFFNYINKTLYSFSLTKLFYSLLNVTLMLVLIETYSNFPKYKSNEVIVSY